MHTENSFGLLGFDKMLLQPNKQNLVNKWFWKAQRAYAKQIN